MGGLLIIMALALSAIIYMTALIIGGSAGI
jgi:hypothetical protein